MQGIPAPPVVSKNNGPTDASTTRTVDAVDATLPQAQSTDAPISVSIAGDANGDFAGVNLLEELIKDDSGLAASVRVINPPKRDANGAQIISDCLGPFIPPPGSTIIIDTMGYSTFVIYHVGSGSAPQVNGSNDGVNFAVSMPGMNLGGGTYALTPQANSAWAAPCLARYVRVAASSGGVTTVYLRNTQYPSIGTALGGIGGGAIPQANNTAGTSGILPVGGAIAPGGFFTGIATAPTYPVLIGALDSGEIKLSTALKAVIPVPLVRSLLTDPNGKLRLAYELNPVSQTTNVAALNVQDTTQQDGAGWIELLAQILQELQINNQLLSELPSILTANLQRPASTPLSFLDEPAAMRTDPTIFNQ